MEDRPAPSPAKLLNQFNDWVEETELPGRTLSYMKTGYLPDVLAAAESGVTSEMLEAWSQWEAGKTDPQAVLEVLRDEGLAAVLAELAA